MVLSGKEGQTAIVPQASISKGAKLFQKEQSIIWGGEAAKFPQIVENERVAGSRSLMVFVLFDPTSDSGGSPSLRSSPGGIRRHAAAPFPSSPPILMLRIAF